MLLSVHTPHTHASVTGKSQQVGEVGSPNLHAKSPSLVPIFG